MPAVAETLDTVQSVTEGTYKWGFETEIEMDFAPKGLNEDTVRCISAQKKEPEWLLEWRLKAFATWQKMQEPRWPAVKYPPIDDQDAYYYAAPKKKDGPKSLDEVDPELLKTYAKLGIPLKEQAILAGVEGAGETLADGGPGQCEAQGICAVRGRWDPVNDAIRRALSDITLADLAGTARCASAPVFSQLVAE